MTGRERPDTFKLLIRAEVAIAMPPGFEKFPVKLREGVRLPHSIL
jgi:hypothetical protein